ncbi:hypothetical protein LTR53_020188, partial [Teratosphaeriaceae sp. CCFEE 6253]
MGFDVVKVSLNDVAKALLQFRRSERDILLHAVILVRGGRRVDVAVGWPSSSILGNMLAPFTFACLGAQHIPGKGLREQDNERQ